MIGVVLFLTSVFSLFNWLPFPLRYLFVGAVSIFVLVGLFKIISAVVHLIADIIPGW